MTIFVNILLFTLLQAFSSNEMLVVAPDSVITSKDSFNQTLSKNIGKESLNAKTDRAKPLDTEAETKTQKHDIMLQFGFSKYLLISISLLLRKDSDYANGNFSIAFSYFRLSTKEITLNCFNFVTTNHAYFI